jgi:mRNA interferase MazF
MNAMSYQKGDIVIVPVPFSDNQRYKLRPALVLSNDLVHKTGDILIAQITSKSLSDGLSFSIKDNDLTLKLPLTSYVRIHKLFVLEEGLIKGKISHLKTEVYKQIIEQIIEVIS